MLAAAVLAAGMHARPGTADDGGASRTQYWPNWPYPGWIEEEVIGVVPGACTGTAEPELEVRRFPIAAPDGAPWWASREAEPVAMAFGSPSLGLAQAWMPGAPDLVYTHDGGRTWHSPGSSAIQHPFSRDGLEIAFVDARTGWAMGWGGHGPSVGNWPFRAVVTFDGGATWRDYVSAWWGDHAMAQMLAGTTARRGRWRMPDGATAVAYVSTDGGMSWSVLPAPWSRAEAERNVRHYDRLVLFGEQRLFLSASDIDFPVIEPDWDALEEALFGPYQGTAYGMSQDPLTDVRDPNRRWVLPAEVVDRETGRAFRTLSLPPYLLRTEDGGGTWRRVPLLAPPAWSAFEGLRSVHLQDILMVDEAHGWLEVSIGTGRPEDWRDLHYCTADGGATWHLAHSWEALQYPPIGRTNFAITFALDYRHIWINDAFNMFRIAPIEAE